MVKRVMFDKNIEALKEVNNVLAEKLIQFPSEKMMEGLRVMSAQSGDYVLEKDGIVLDNLENPVEGIKKDIFNNIKTSPSRTDFILIFGIGMGYILDEVFFEF